MVILQLWVLRHLCGNALMRSKPYLMKQNAIYKILGLSCAAVSSALPTTLAAAEPERPNILIIFTDDQGYADLGCFGSTTNKTPNFDNLAAQGTIFNEFYAQHVSGPSRSALMTGRYPLRSLGKNMPAEELTIAEAVKSVGYETACIGKWELSSRKEIVERMPLAQGFDYYYGTLGANDSGKAQMYSGDKKDRVITDMSEFSKLYTDKAIEFLEGRDTESPFFLYIAHTMLHSMVGASEEFIGRSDRGVYGDAVEELDYETGRLLDKLEEMGLRENTLIIYTTDNGPWCQPKYQAKVANKYPEGEIYWGDSGVLRDGKGSVYEGGSRVPCIMSWPDHIPMGMVKDGVISTLDFMPTFARLCGYEMRDDVIIDGVDQSNFIMSKRAKSARDSFCYLQITVIGQVRNEDFLAIRDDRWKLLMPDRKPDKEHVFLADFGTNDYELYDLKSDPSESVNLVDKYPKVVERMKAKHAQMALSFKAEK